MSQSVEGLEIFKPAVVAFRNEPGVNAVPDWLLAMRDRGSARLEKDGLPTRQLEAWKYTNLAPLLEGTWEAAESLTDDTLPDRRLFSTFDGDKSGDIVLLNGRFIRTWSTASIDRIKIRTSNEVEMMPAADPRELIQESVNASFMRDMIVIDIEPGTILKKPLVISTFSLGTHSLTKWSVSAPRVVINVGAGCEVAIIEMTGGEGRTINASVTSLRIAKGSRVTHARVNSNQDSGIQLGSTQVSIARDAFCETFQFTLSGRLSREDLNIYLNETGAEAVLDGLYLVDGKRHVDHSTVVEHLAPHTSSSQLYKGVLNDESRAVFNGKVRIHRDAQKSNASQLNNNLILSKRAEIDTKPELEIDADDVKASHGATIGQIDPDHVFYLRARAISEVDAIKILSKGFAQDVAFRISNDGVREFAQKSVEAALSKTEKAHVH